ncbi:Lactation elevated protein 1, partial [Tetrabaena socialis]
LFGRLWEAGLVLVATSNRHPDDLYKGGLQRNLFMPFIHRLKLQCRAHDMASATDYRRLAQHQIGLYFVAPGASAAVAAAAAAKPAAASAKQTAAAAAATVAAAAPAAAAVGAAAAATVAPATAPAAAEAAAVGDALLERFAELAGPGAAAAAPSRVEVSFGRTLEVPVAAGRACMFPFPELCGRPVAAADYLALSSSFHTLALRGVPAFGAANRSEAYRFVTLIDVLYEARAELHKATTRSATL